MSDKDDFKRGQAIVSRLTNEAERLGKKENFTSLNMLGILCTMAVYWAKEHGIPAKEYVRISNELLDAMTHEEERTK